MVRERWMRVDSTARHGQWMCHTAEPHPGGVPVKKDASWTELAAVLRHAAEGDRSLRAPAGDGDAGRAAMHLNALLERLAAAETAAEETRRALAEGQSDLQAMHRRLGPAQRLAALGALVATIAHELGTPLHSVAGHLDLMMADPDLPPRLKERAQVVAGEVDRLAGLIRRHLRRLRTPMPEARPTPVNEVLRRIEQVMHPVFDARGIEVEMALDPEASEPWPCDAAQVEQVVLNLIQNAMDAMPEGGRLLLQTAATEGGRAISVSDTGCGVERENADRVFEPFFTTKGGNGTGLGLSLCREIARRHGGDIVLHYQPGQGTVVTLTLGTVPGSETDE